MRDAAPPKRVKVSDTPPSAITSPSTATATAIAAAVTGEPALLRNILSFTPATHAENTYVSAPVVAVQAMAALCRAIPGLSRLVGPTNEAFWREMVLTHFDFQTSGDIFNVEDWGGDWCDDGDAVDDDCDDPEYAHWHRHPKNGPRREWLRDHPVEPEPSAEPSLQADTDAHGSEDDQEESDEDDDSDDCNTSDDEDDNYPSHFLVDGLAFWPALQTHFKPGAYGFLETIQLDRSKMEALWPDHEDAFSLFCDLLLLPHFESTDVVEWETWSDGFQPVYPCLMGRFPTKIVGRGFAMLKFCDFAPCFWTGSDDPVSKRWSGVDGPLPSIECKWKTLREQKRAEDDDTDHSECEQRTLEERSIFPGSQSQDAHPFLHLRRFVNETFSDWRRIHVNQCEMASPEFYIGSTKRSGRWMGFVGQSDYRA